MPGSGPGGVLARLPDRWAFWSLISGGLALARHTSPP